MRRSVVARAVDDLDAVREQRRDGIKRFDGAFRAAGKIEDQRVAANGGETARQNGARSVFDALSAHLLRNSWDEPVRDRLRDFGSGIARAQSSAAGGQNEIDGVSIGDLAEECLDLRRIIRKKMRGGDGPVQLLATRDQRGSGAVWARSVGDRI